MSAERPIEDAVHEAGHAVAATVLGIELLQVEVTIDPDEMPGQTLVKMPAWVYKRSSRPLYGLDDGDTQRIHDAATYHWAGPAAREYVCGTAPVGTILDDEINLHKLALHLAPEGSDELVALKSGFKESARQLVRQPAVEQAIREVAITLSQHGTLSGSEVHKIVRERLGPHTQR